MRKTSLILSLIFLASTGAAVQTFGTGDARPVVKNVTVYDVTNAADRETGGTLETFGLENQLNITQRNETQYRISFRVGNEGTQNWSLESADVLNHSGLNTSWNVTKIWYNISRDYDGGSFSSGEVSWNTSRGGELDTTGENSTLYAKYLLNISGSSETRQLEFKVNDTSNSTGSTDTHDLKYVNLGEIRVSMQDPQDDTVLQKDDFFDLNATVECVEGRCGNVTSTSRYNRSDTADTVINGSGDPFHVKQYTEKYCLLGRGETCQLNWRVNASGSADTYHLLDVNASSNYSEIPENDSSDSLVQIKKLVYLNLQFKKIDFGVLEVGSEDKPAKGNVNASYNVTIPEESYEANLWINSTDMISQQDSSYRIGAGNISFSRTNSSSTSQNLSNDYQKLADSVQPGTNVTTFYWLDTPFGITDGDYLGTVKYKANATQ